METGVTDPAPTASARELMKAISFWMGATVELSCVFTCHSSRRWRGNLWTARDVIHDSRSNWLIACSPRMK